MKRAALLMMLLAGAANAATRYPVTIISGTTTTYVDTVYFSSGVDSITQTNLPSGERKATIAIAAGTSGTTTQQVIDITGPLYYPLSLNPSNYVTDTSSFVTNGGFTINVVGGETQTVSNAGSITITSGSSYDVVSASIETGLVTWAQMTSKADSNQTVSVAINGTTNSVTVGAGGLMEFTVSAGATFSPTWVEAVNFASWATPFAGPTSSSNAIAPIWIFAAATTNDVIAFGGTSSQTILQDAYREASACPPFGSTAWGGETALVVRVYGSTNAATFAKLDLKMVSPSGVLFTTNALTGGNGGTFADYYFLTSQVPAFVSCNATQSWLFRIVQYIKSSHTNGIDSIRWNVK